MNTRSPNYSTNIHEAVTADDAALIEDAFELGHSAGRATVAIFNPYEKNSVPFHVWNIGHDAAVLDADAATLTAALDARC